MIEIQTLNDATSGAYEVLTESGSVYLINFDAPSLQRVVKVPVGAVEAPVVGKDVNYGEYRTDHSILRGDNAELELIAVQSCVVGQKALFAVSGLQENPNLVTVRITTSVVSITQI